MRIVAGKYGGRRLEVPGGRDIRPTSDKVRGAVFNALESMGAVRGARVLDCFCGTGALGLEALSRGAEFCSFMDKDKRSLALTRSNAERLDAALQSEFFLRDAQRFIRPSSMPKYSLVFLDPPYRKGLIDIVLQALEEGECFDTAAVIVLESEKGYAPNMSGSFTVQSTKTYGDTQVQFLNYTGQL
ncbi:MAG TPA: 16S rRNA (guanine(966)-N(2))-methyltransferase RsmD [Alphaproteobacteria bacterium]|nr:16S rRNA (guanine(966)-N(2))-methyltransferase RsmD [Alphaproteobacteria bacterium]USO05356.1 MAG: 16S rRNA (guanine(966)-N(2))-methyltransferase RsmD [Rhodospirillales bacterium]HOO81725.1 16S rRNA (guanine(966)-N(2))-methyltransferase RsmD [Alphaproteobacteria bacterium]